MDTNCLSSGLATKKDSKAGDDNLIPLINIVFLLLIFFLVAGQVTPLAQMLVDAPMSNSEKPVDLSHATITLDKNSHLFMDGQKVEANQLALMVNTIKPESVNLYVDQTLTAQQLDEVLAPLREAGVVKMTLFSLTAEG